jgi:outer membrane protein
MMKTMIKAGLLALLLGGVSAQAGDFKVGVVDTERVLRESVPAMNAEKKIEKEFSGRDQDIKKLIKQAKDLQTLLEKEGAAMSDAEHRNKERELTALNVDLQRLQREFREDLNLRKNEELAMVLELANKAIQTIADTEKFDLILQEAVYRNPKIDITDKVIKQLAADNSDVKTDSKEIKDSK